MDGVALSVDRRASDLDIPLLVVQSLTRGDLTVIGRVTELLLELATVRLVGLIPVTKAMEESNDPERPCLDCMVARREAKNGLVGLIASDGNAFG